MRYINYIYIFFTFSAITVKEIKTYTQRARSCATTRLYIYSTGCMCKKINTLHFILTKLALFNGVALITNVTKVIDSSSNCLAAMWKKLVGNDHM